MLAANDLTDYLNKLVSYCTEKNKDIKEKLNQRIVSLDNEFFVQYIINAYKITENSDEKTKLKQLLIKLLELGANPNECDKHDGSPLLHRAIKLRSQSLVNIIITSTEIDYSKKQHKMGLTPLQVCLKHWPKNIDLIKSLSGKNNDELQTIFTKAINDEDKTSIIFLIQNQLVDFNQPDSEGRLPLHLLCIQGNAKLISFIFTEIKKQGKQIDFAKLDAKNNSALHYACHAWSSPKLNIVEWLLKNKINPNQANHQGDYPLHLMIETDKPEIVTLLLKYGADPEKVDRQGRIAAMKIIMRPEIVRDVNMLSQLWPSNPSLTQFNFSQTDPIQVAFEQGFWIRGIGVHARGLKEAVDREVNILQKREKMEFEELDRHDPTFDVQKNIAYYFSPATFVKANIPTDLFSSDKFGLIVQTGRKIPAWCSGLAGSVMTEDGHDINFDAKELHFTYDKNHQIQNATTLEIGLMFQRLAKQYIRDNSPLELYDELMEPSYIPYNEGLFRYVKSEIQAFVVSEAPISAFYALRFQEKLPLKHLHFYRYEVGGRVIQISSEKVSELAKQYDSTIPENKFSALFQTKFLKPKPNNTRTVVEQPVAKRTKTMINSPP